MFRILICMIIFLCSACAEHSRSDNVDNVDNNIHDLIVWVDPDTGCKYIIQDRTLIRAITPKLNDEGKPDCD